MDTFAEKIGMALDTFLEEQAIQPFELIHGEKIIRIATVFGHSEVLQALFLAIYLHLMTHKISGNAYTETTYILPGAYSNKWVENSRIPDVMYYAPGRIAAYKAAETDAANRPLELVPDFVAEVISPNDRYSQMDEKVDIYLQDGVRLVVLVDPQRRKVTCYAPDFEQPIVLKEEAILNLSNVIPNLQIPVATLFES